MNLYQCFPYVVTNSGAIRNNGIIHNDGFCSRKKWLATIPDGKPPTNQKIEGYEEEDDGGFCKNRSCGKKLWYLT